MTGLDGGNGYDGEDRRAGDRRGGERESQGSGGRRWGDDPQSAGAFGSEAAGHEWRRAPTEEILGSSYDPDWDDEELTDEY